MQTEFLPLDQLIPYENNARINDKAIKSVCKSLEEFGWQQPIVVDKNMVIIVGHTRLKAAQKLGMKEAWVKIERDLSPEKMRMYRLADNIRQSEWDMEKLGFEYGELKDVFNFKDFDFDVSFEEENKPGNTDPDAIPEQVEAVCELGDLWELGEHRLLCGDSTKAEDVERLMNGEKADMVFTDPPYGMNYKSNWKNPVSKTIIKNDNNYVADWISSVVETCYCFCRFDSYSILEKSIKEKKLKIFNCLVWDKLSHTAGDLNSWANTHEFLVYFGKHKTTTSREQNVLRFRRLDNGAIGKKCKDNMVHPNQKPINLIEFVFSCESNSNNIYDPFLGSGSTLIACEKTGRKCYGMELDPKYCDVIIKRWQDFTGKEAREL